MEQQRWTSFGARFGLAFVWTLPAFVAALFMIPSPTVPSSVQVGGAIGTVFFLAWARRGATVHVSAGPGGLVCRGVTRTRRFPWTEVSAVDVAPWFGADVPRLHRKGQRPVLLLPLLANYGEHTVPRTQAEQINAHRPAGIDSGTS